MDGADGLSLEICSLEFAGSRIHAFIGRIRDGFFQPYLYLPKPPKGGSLCDPSNREFYRQDQGGVGGILGGGAET